MVVFVLGPEIVPTLCACTSPVPRAVFPSIAEPLRSKAPFDCEKEVTKRGASNSAFVEACLQETGSLVYGRTHVRTAIWRASIVLVYLVTLCACHSYLAWQVVCGTGVNHQHAGL